MVASSGTALARRSRLCTYSVFLGKLRRLQMTQLKRIMGTYILSAVLVQTVAAHAATYYVATTGSNSNPGTENQPWQTVAHAVSTMVAGDTTYVRGGIYREGIIRFGKSGSQSAPIKLLNYPSESPIINCIDPAQTHRIILQHASGFQKPMGWITIEGFEIRNCYDGLKFHNAHDLTIKHNWIHNNAPGQGILGNGMRVLIDGNVINHNGGFDECVVTPSECNKDHGIYASGTAFTITNNLIYDNLSHGIQAAGAYSYDRTKHAGQEYVRCDDWIIANNTIAYQVYRSAIVVWGSSFTNFRIENNIFYENGVKLEPSAVQGIDFVSKISGLEITIRNNLAYASGTGAKAFLGRGGIEHVQYTQSGNIVNTEHPEFINAPAILPTSPDFKLTRRSPAIDTGLTLPEVSRAIDGTVRPKGHAYDIGAYEYNPDSDVRSPNAPTALRFMGNLSQD